MEWALHSQAQLEARRCSPIVRWKTLERQPCSSNSCLVPARGVCGLWVLSQEPRREKSLSARWLVIAAHAGTGLRGSEVVGFRRIICMVSDTWPRYSTVLYVLVVPGNSHSQTSLAGTVRLCVCVFMIKFFTIIYDKTYWLEPVSVTHFQYRRESTKCANNVISLPSLS